MKRKTRLDPFPLALCLTCNRYPIAMSQLIVLFRRSPRWLGLMNGQLFIHSGLRSLLLE